MKATELRIIIVKPHHNKANFFGQVGLVALEVKGESIDHVIPGSTISSLMGSRVRKGSGSFEGQSSLLMQLKESFVRREQF